MASENIIILDTQSFDSEVGKKENGPLLVDFWAEWCHPCRLMAPVLDKVAQKYQGRLRVAKVDVDGNQELAAKYGVVSIPTLLLFKDGQVVEQMVGAKSEEDLARVVDPHTP